MSIDVMIATLAARQYGVVATWQIRELGGDRHLVRRRVAAGRWERHTSRVVGIAGAPSSPEQQLMIAILHVGPTAIASHESAAWVWGLPGFAATDVVLRSRSHGAPADQGHRPTLLLPHHRMEVRGIPVTSLPRTLFDLAAIVPLGRLARLVDSVVARSPGMLPALHRTLPEIGQRGRTGIRAMRVLLDERPVGSTIPATGLERRFEQVCENAGIRGFERQVDVGGHSWLGRVDYVRRDVRLLVEVDSELHHTTVTDQASDAARDAAMLAAGWAMVVRVTEEDLWYRPWLVVEALRAALRKLGAAAA